MNRIVKMVGLAAPNPNVSAGSSHEGHRAVFLGTPREFITDTSLLLTPTICDFFFQDFFFFNLPSSTFLSRKTSVL